jgi:eukaryotic-like serine/threonine-protein kinase
LHRALQLGRYHLLDRIAFGGMAEIFRAKTFDRGGHAHLVAVKKVLSHLAEDEDFLQMLVDEAKIASLIQHPNVAKVYELTRAGGEHFIAMEYVDGKDTRTILERCRQLDRPVPPQHAAFIAAEIATALHAAHTGVDHDGRPLRLVHRDVSPSNVICAYTGEVKLCDFGIAKASLSRVQTKAGVIKGKVKYMSPEQALGRRLDGRSDLFSLGSVLYEMLTKNPPFLAPNEMDMLLKVRDAKVVPVRSLEPGVPEALARILEKALKKNRDDRYLTAEDLATDLRRFLDSHHPGYTRSHLGRYLRKMFEREIERELRLLEEYVLGESNAADVGVNLIADALGPHAPYSSFTPEPSQSGSVQPGLPTPPPPLTPPVVPRAPARKLPRSDWGDEASEAHTRPQPQRPPRSPPSDVHGAETRILDPSARAARAEVSIHDQPTLILDRPRSKK